MSNTAAAVPDVESIISDVLQEVQNQVDRWGNQKYPDGTGSPAFGAMADAARKACDRADQEQTTTWLHIAREEFWEAMAEQDKDRLRQELVQLIAVGVSWVKDIDSRP